jgi:NADPH2:quinone reductase
VKALLSIEPGTADSLQVADAPDPVAGPGTAVIEVAACAVNFPDVLIIEDKYQYKPPRPFAPGGEVSGVVKAVGEGVAHVRPGQRVLAKTTFGGMAEQVAVDARELVVIPDGMPFEEAAGFILTYGTSYHALKDRARLQPGETLLVLGAAGGAGLSAVELGKAMGARVVAAVSTPEKLEICKAHGAADGVVYGRGPFDAAAQRELARLFKAASGPDGAHVVYDAVGGDYAEPALRAVAWEGRYLVVGFAAGQIPRLPANLALLKGCDVLGVFWGEWTNRFPERQKRNAEELLRLYMRGEIKPFVSASFPLERGGEAIRLLAERRAVGKVVVTMPRYAGTA